MSQHIEGIESELQNLITEIKRKTNLREVILIFV